MPASTKDVATAIGDISVRTGQTGKSLEGLATQMLNLSRVGKADLTPLVAATTRAFGDWSISTANQSKALDYLFRTSQQTGIGVVRLTELVVQFGAPLRALGFSFEEGAALMGKWEKEGVNLETVLAGLRFALGNFAKAGKDPQQALLDVQAAIKGAKTESEATAIAFQTFGKRAAVDMSRAIIEGRFNIDELVQSLKNSKETINKAAEDTLSLSEKFERLKNRVEIALEPIGTSLVKVLEHAVTAAEPLVATIGKLAEAFSKLPDGVQTVVIGMAAVVAAAGPVLYVFGQLSLSAAAITAAFGKKGIATRALAGDLAALEGSAVKTTGVIGLLGKAAGITGALLAGWEIGRLIADLTGLDQKIADTITGVSNLERARGLTRQGKGAEAEAEVTAKITELEKQRTNALVHFNLVQAAVIGGQIEALKNDQTRLAIQDVINKAIAGGAAATINYADAIKFNESALQKQQAAAAAAAAALNQSTKAAHGAAEATSLLTQLNATYAADLKKIGTSGFTEIVQAHTVYGKSVKDLAEQYHVAESSIERYLDASKAGVSEAKKSADAARENATAFTNLNGATRERVQLLLTQGASESNIAKDLHVTATQVKEVHESMVNTQAIEAEWTKTHQEWAKSTRKLVEDTADAFIKAQRAVADASGASLIKMVMERQKFQERVNVIGMTGTTLALHQLEVQRQAEVDALGKRTEQNQLFWDENKRNIDTFYQHQQRLALGTFDTIAERMHAHGVLTKRELQDVADAAKRDYEQMKASGLFTYDELAAAAKRSAEAQRKAQSGLFDSILSQLDQVSRSLSSSFSQIAESTSGSVSRIAGFISSIAKAWDEAGAAAKAYAEATTLAEKAAAIGQGIAALANATDPRGKSAAGTAASGAAAGARLGAVAGPYGMAIGAGVGALIGWWRSAHAEWRKVSKDIGKDIGQDISQGLAQQIADMAKTLSGGTKQQRREWAELFSLDAIISEAGGLKAENVRKYEQEATKLFDVIRQGGKMGAQATEELNTLIGEFGAQAEKTGGMWDPVFKNLIAQSQALGINIDAVTAAIDKQIDKLSGGLGKAVSGAFAGTDDKLSGIVKGLAKDEAAALDDAFKHAQETGFKGTINDYFVQQAQLYRTAQEGDPRLKTFFMGDTLTKFDDLTTSAQAAFDRLSRTALASFNAIIANGHSAAEAIGMIGGAVDQLIAEHDKLGLAGGAAYDQLARFRTLVKDNEALVASVGWIYRERSAAADGAVP